MTKTVATLACVLVLAAPDASRADARAIELRVTVRPGTRAGDPPESARQLALTDARRQARQMSVVRLQERSDIKALKLTTAHLEAFTTVLVDVVEPAPGSTPNGRVDVVAWLDGDGAARVMSGLRKDQDVTFELVDARRRIQRLHDQLDDLARRRARATGDEAASLLREQLQSAVTLEVQHVIARAYASLARTEPTTVGGRAIPASGHERARQLADRALALAPDSADAHYLMGDVLVESEQAQAAEAEYRRALTDAPSSVGRTKLAAALRLQGKLPEALSELAEARRIDPTYARAHADTGMILRAERKLPEAILAYRDAVRLDPDSTEAHNGLAVSFANSGKLEEAVAEFREVIRIDSDSTIGYYNLAYALADLDRDVESAAAFREVIRINPDHYNARYNLGELFRLEGKYDDAATQFREYLRLAPDTPGNRRNITRATGFIRQFEDPNAPVVPDTMMPRPPR